MIASRICSKQSCSSFKYNLPFRQLAVLSLLSLGSLIKHAGLLHAGLLHAGLLHADLLRAGLLHPDVRHSAKSYRLSYVP